MTKLFELKNKIKISPSIKMIFFECLSFALGFYLASVRFIFGLYPFGIAFLCASRRFSVFSFCGSLLCYVFFLDFNLPYITALSCAFGLRIICSLIQKKEGGASIILGTKGQKSVLNTLFYENTSVRVAVSCFCALSLGVYYVIESDFNFFEIFSTLFFVVLLGVFTFAFCGAFGARHKKAFALSVCALAFALLYGIRDFELWGINIALVLSCALVLYTSRYMGLSSSGALGLLLGICFGASFAPCLAILGLVSAFLWKTSSYIAIMSAFVVAGAYGVFASGYEAIIYLAPELLLSCLLMYAFLKFEALPVPAFVQGFSKADCAPITSKEELISSTVKKTRGVLEEISSIMKDVSKKSKLPSKQDYAAICYDSCKEHCFTCPKHSICWEKDLATTEQNLKRLSSAASASKEVNGTDVSEKFLHRCPNIDVIIKEINEKISENRTQGIKNDKLEVSSTDFEIASRLIGNAFERALDSELCDHTATAKIVRAASKIGFVCERIEVLGTCEKKIIAYDVDTERTKCNATTLKDTFEGALGIKLSEPTFDIGEKTTMLIKSAKTFEARCVTVSSPSSESEINGDSTVCFEGAGSKFYAVLCDGMGSGQNARLTSLLCTGFLQKLLKKGADTELSLMTLNSFVRSRGKESTCTIDLLELDLTLGKGRLIKCGAAPTLVKRGDNVFKIESKTMPIGIMKSLDAESHGFEFKSGDRIIMLSDGVLCDENDLGHLISMLKSAPAPDDNALCAKILEEMKPRHDHSDDMTVSVVTIL